MVACASPSWREAPGGWGLHLFGSLPCPWYLKGHRWPQALIYVSHSGPAAVPSVSYTVFCLILKTTLWGRYYWCSFYRHGSWKALNYGAFLSPKLFPWTSDLIWLSSLQPLSQPSALGVSAFLTLLLCLPRSLLLSILIICFSSQLSYPPLSM